MTSCNGGAVGGIGTVGVEMVYIEGKIGVISDNGTITQISII